MSLFGLWVTLVMVGRVVCGAIFRHIAVLDIVCMEVFGLRGGGPPPYLIALPPFSDILWKYVKWSTYSPTKYSHIYNNRFLSLVDILIY